MEFYSCRGNVIDFSYSQGTVREKMSSVKIAQKTFLKMYHSLSTIWQLFYIVYC